MVKLLQCTFSLLLYECMCCYELTSLQQTRYRPYSRELKVEGKTLTRLATHNPWLHRMEKALDGLRENVEGFYVSGQVLTIDRSATSDTSKSPV